LHLQPTAISARGGLLPCGGEFIESAQDRNGQLLADERFDVFIERFEVRRHEVRIQSLAAFHAIL
jgi:hypothetical protein